MSPSLYQADHEIVRLTGSGMTEDWRHILWSYTLAIG